MTEPLRRRRKQDSLVRIFGWSSLGIILPGANFLAAGIIGLGVLILVTITAALGALFYWARNTDLRTFALDTLSRENTLYIVIGASLLIGLFWSAQYIIGFFALHRHRLTRTKKIVSRIIAGIITVLIFLPFAFASYYAYETHTTLTQVFAGGTEEKRNTPSVYHTDPWANVSRVNVLALGSDETAHREGVRPDVIMVASIDPQTGETALFNIPRNLRHTPFQEGTPGDTTFPTGFTYGEGLINEVWTWAETVPHLYSSDNPGLTATQDAVEGALGLEVDYTLRINMKGFEDLVNALGGVTVDVPRDLPKAKEGVIPDDYVEAGTDQRLDGNDALWYVRSRAGSSDYDRMERTRCMVKALTEEADPQSLVTRYPDLLSVMKQNFHTDMEQGDIQAWAELLNRVQEGGIRGVALTDEVITPYTPDYDAIHALVDEEIEEAGAVTPSPSSTPTPTDSPTGIGVPYAYDEDENTADDTPTDAPDSDSPSPEPVETGDPESSPETQGEEAEEKYC